MPYRTPPSTPAAAVTLAVSLAWRADTIAVRHLLEDGEAGAGDVPGSLGPIPCEGLGVGGIAFAALEGGVGRAHVPAGATGTLRRAGGRALTVDGPATVELDAGDACELVVGEFTLRVAAEARDPAPRRGWALRRPRWLPHVAVVAALHAAVLFVLPVLASWKSDDEEARGVDVAALRAMLGGDDPGPGHDAHDAERTPPVHAEDLEPPKALPVTPEPAAPAPPAPEKPPAPSKRPAQGAPHQKPREVAQGREPTTGALPPAPPEPAGNPTGAGAEAHAVEPPAPPSPPQEKRAADAPARAGQRRFETDPARSGQRVPGDEDPRVCFVDTELKPQRWIRYRITLPDGTTRSGIADRHGGATLGGLKTPIAVKVEWGRDPRSFDYVNNSVVLGPDRGENAAEQHQGAFDALGSLGFTSSSLQDRVRAFQSLHGRRAHPALAVTGDLDPRTWDLLWQIHDAPCE